MAQARPKRTKVFISYSHKDVKWLERLKVHLRPLIRDREIDAWDDTMIAPGSNWREDIKRAIATAKAAILLISADFLASDFIANNELIALLQAAKIGGTIIIPVIISPSGFQQNQIVSQFQAINDPQRPLINLKKGEQEAVWVKVIEAIKSSLNISPEVVVARTNNQTVAYQRPLKKQHQLDTPVISYVSPSEQQDDNDIKIKVEQNYKSKDTHRFTKRHITISITIIASIAVI